MPDQNGLFLVHVCTAAQIGEDIGAKGPDVGELASIENFNALEGMTYARYQLGRYFSDEFSQENAEEQNIYDDLQRAKAS